MKTVINYIAFFCIAMSFAQQTNYDLNAGNGNGVRFWNGSNSYKIHMGNTTTHRYGPVTDYSIKNNMNDNTARGWTWGVNGRTPIAGLNTQGNFQIAGSFIAMEKIGIGTTNPTANLEISSGTSGDAVLRIVADTDNSKEDDNPRIEMYQDGGLIGVHIGFNEAPATPRNIFQIGTYTPGKYIRDALTIDPYNGHVGIGTLNPDSKLSVNGTIHTKEVVIDQNGWADYVFKADYQLLSLKAVDTFIKEQGHLPNVPSEAEIIANGLSISEISTTFMEKIEELTLYTIQQEKALLQKQEKIEALEARLAQLEIVVNKIITNHE